MTDIDSAKRTMAAGKAIAGFTEGRLTEWTVESFREAKAVPVYSRETLQWFGDVAARMDMVGAATLGSVPEYQLDLVLTPPRDPDVSTLFDVPAAREPLTPSSPEWARRWKGEFGTCSRAGLELAAAQESSPFSPNLRAFMRTLAGRLEQTGYRTINDVPDEELDEFMRP